jgi:hypothetical protein
MGLLVEVAVALSSGVGVQLCPFLLLTPRSPLAPRSKKVNNLIRGSRQKRLLSGGGGQIKLLLTVCGGGGGGNGGGVGGGDEAEEGGEGGVRLVLHAFLKGGAATTGQNENSLFAPARSIPSFRSLSFFMCFLCCARGHRVQIKKVEIVTYIYNFNKMNTCCAKDITYLFSSNIFFYLRQKILMIVSVVHIVTTTNK